MHSPPTRVGLNQTELALISSGLGHIIKRASTALSTPDLLPRGLKKLYNKRMLSMLRHLRAKLTDNSSGEVDLTAVEIAAALFALRTTRKKRLWQYTGSNDSRREREPKQAMDQLAKKLESYRKRAKRATISRLGDTKYDERQQNWQRFIGWLRAAMQLRDHKRKPVQIQAAPSTPASPAKLARATQVGSPQEAPSDPDRLSAHRFLELTREVIHRCTSVRLSTPELKNLAES